MVAIHEGKIFPIEHSSLGQHTCVTATKQPRNSRVTALLHGRVTVALSSPAASLLDHRAAGNDFLPHMPALDIRDGAIDAMLIIYKKCVSSHLRGYVTSNGEVNFPRLQVAAPL